MKILLTFFVLLFSSSVFAESWNCYFQGPNDTEQLIIFERKNNTSFIIKSEENDLSATIVYETNRHLTLTMALLEYAMTIVIDKEEKYFEAVQIQLFVKRPLNKVKGGCDLIQ